MSGKVQTSPVIGVGESGGQVAAFIGAPPAPVPPVEVLEWPPLATLLPPLEVLPAFEALLPPLATSVPEPPEGLPFGELLDPPHAAVSTPPTNKEAIPYFNVFITGLLIAGPDSCSGESGDPLPTTIEDPRVGSTPTFGKQADLSKPCPPTSPVSAEFKVVRPRSQKDRADRGKD